MRKDFTKSHCIWNKILYGPNQFSWTICNLKALISKKLTLITCTHKFLFILLINYFLIIVNITNSKFIWKRLKTYCVQGRFYYEMKF